MPRKPVLFCLVSVAVTMVAAGLACTAQPTGTPTPAMNAGTDVATPTALPTFDADAYFNGQTIRLVHGTAPGGPVDTRIRLYARYLPKYLPGGESVRFLVESIPGGGQLRGHQTVYAAEPNGFTVGSMNGRWWWRPLVLEQEIPDWDPLAVILLPGPREAGGFEPVMVDRSVASSWSDVRALGRPITIGLSERGGAPGVEWLEAIGGPVQVVVGYGGRSELWAAFDRGELDTLREPQSTSIEIYPEWYENNRVAPLFYSGDISVGSEFVRDFGFEPTDFIHVLDLDGISYTDGEATVLRIAERAALDNNLFLPPGTPEHIAQVWDAAVWQMFHDPDFVRDYEAAIGEKVSPMAAADIRAVLTEAAALDQAVKNSLSELLGEG